MKKLVLIMCVILINIVRADIMDSFTSQLCGIKNMEQQSFKQLALTSQRVLQALQKQNPNILMQALKEQIKSYQMIINTANQSIEFFDYLGKTIIPVSQQNPIFQQAILGNQEIIQEFQELIHSTQKNISIYQIYHTGEEFLKNYNNLEYFLDFIQFSHQKLEVLEAELKECNTIKGVYQ